MFYKSGTLSLWLPLWMPCFKNTFKSNMGLSFKTFFSTITKLEIYMVAILDNKVIFIKKLNGDNCF